MDSNLGWKGPEKYVATAPQLFDMWQDPQERYDIFMNNYTEHTWAMQIFDGVMQDLMKSYVKYPPRKQQSVSYSGPITLQQYERFSHVRKMLEKGGISFTPPSN